MIELNYPLGNVSSFDSLSVILSPDSNHLEEHGSCAGHKAPTAHLYWTHSYLLSSKIAQIIIFFFFMQSAANLWLHSLEYPNICGANPPEWRLKSVGVPCWGVGGWWIRWFPANRSELITWHTSQTHRNIFSPKAATKKLNLLLLFVFIFVLTFFFL